MEDKRIKLLEEFQEFRSSITEETDRGCALMAASYLDESLKSLFCEVFVEESSVIKELFSATGPLGTFSSRINLAYAIGLISKTAHRDLHLIRKIRNDFGHTPKKIDFETASIAHRCKELYNDGYEKDVDPRRKFERCASGLLGQIHAQTLTSIRIQEKEDIPIEKRRETQAKFERDLLDLEHNLFQKLDAFSLDKEVRLNISREARKLLQERIKESVLKVEKMLKDLEESLSMEDTEKPSKEDQ